MKIKNLTEAGPEEKPLFWFPFNVGAWYSDRAIRLMKDFQRGWYISLMVESWQGRGTIPDDPAVLWKLAGAQSQEIFERDAKLVLSQFQQAELDGQPVLVHPEMAKTYIQQRRKYEQKCEAARISAEKRGRDRQSGESAAGEEVKPETAIIH